MPTKFRSKFRFLFVLVLSALACRFFCGFAAAARDEPQAAVSAPRLGGRITAVFQGLRSRDGYLRVSLYDRADGFPDGSPVARRDFLLTALNPKTPLDSLSVTFDGLPAGAYAVCAFHDRDGSGRLTQNFLGIPQEEWGMSNDPRPRFRAPRFEQARLGLSALEFKTITIRLHK